MTTVKNQFLELTLSAITFVIVLGALALIWPGIIALILGIFLLLQSFMSEPEIAVLSWAEISNMPMVFTSLRRSDPPAILL